LAEEMSRDSFEDKLVRFKVDKTRKPILKATKFCRVSLRIIFVHGWLNHFEHLM